MARAVHLSWRPCPFDEPPLALAAATCLFLCLHERQQPSDCLLHHSCALHHLGQKHLPCPEKIPHDAHPGHQRIRRGPRPHDAGQGVRRRGGKGARGRGGVTAMNKAHPLRRVGTVHTTPGALFHLPSPPGRGVGGEGLRLTVIDVVGSRHCRIQSLSPSALAVETCCETTIHTSPAKSAGRARSGTSPQTFNRGAMRRRSRRASAAMALARSCGVLIGGGILSAGPFRATFPP